jgi:hypothetical protein
MSAELKPRTSAAAAEPSPSPPKPKWRPPPRRHRRELRPGCSTAAIVAAVFAITASTAYSLLHRWRAAASAAAAAASAAAATSTAVDAVSGPLAHTVYERGLVTRRVTPASILQQHAGFYHNVSRRVSPGRVLGFVSPWSRRGEEVAWRFGSKLTHLAPLMYSISAACQLRSHEKSGWLSALRDGLHCTGCPPPARLVPVVSMRDLLINNATSFFLADDAEQQQGKLLLALLQAALTKNLDGFVLDAHSHLEGLPRDTQLAVRPKLHVFVQLLASQLSLQGEAAGLELLLLVPPNPALFSPAELAQLAQPLGGVIVATSNYSSDRGRAGPTAPLEWMGSALAALKPPEKALPKLMAVLPMAGWDFTLPSGPNKPLDAEGYLELLEAVPPKGLDWYTEAAEHVFQCARETGDDARAEIRAPPPLSPSRRLRRAMRILWRACLCLCLTPPRRAPQVQGRLGVAALGVLPDAQGHRRAARCAAHPRRRRRGVGARHRARLLVGPAVSARLRCGASPGHGCLHRLPST